MGTSAPATAKEQKLDLTNCDREQVQFISAILPHGVLIALREPDLTILQASLNSSELLGIPAQQLLGSSLATVLDHDQFTKVQELSHVADLAIPQHLFRATAGEAEFDVLAHRSAGVLILEFEKRTASRLNDQDVIDMYSEIRHTLARLGAAPNVQVFLDLAVSQVRKLTGFDRVMAYQFMPDGSGWVRAESLQEGEGLQPYLEQHFPASDIPEPARRLLTKSWLRHQPDIGYTAVPLLPAGNPATGEPLDMSCSVLRSVSVMYTGYLKNLGTQSSMVMTLLKEGQLWGLIACHHHRSPRHVAWEIRTACEFLAHMVSLLLSAKQELETRDYQNKMQSVAGQWLNILSQADDLCAGLRRLCPNLLEFVHAGGAAVFMDGEIEKQGNTPSDEQLRVLTNFLSIDVDRHLFATDSMAGELPESASYKEVASGVLAIRLAGGLKHFMLWFRPEQVQTVSWAGDPNKPVDITADGQRLTPRTSFALWQETVRLKSHPWLDIEIAAARDLRAAILEFVLRKAEKLGHLYEQLQHSHSELDTFAYVASHDLKEPLRGISNYSKMLQEDCGEELGAEARARLKTLGRLAQRMDSLLDSLLEYSRVGRIGFSDAKVNLTEVAEDAVDTLLMRSGNSNVEIRIIPDLPVVTGDQVRLGEVFLNLISNSIKYNRNEKKIIEVGAEPVGSGGTVEVYVRDNGIGIDAAHHEQIFQIFRRLHGRDEFGGGSGVGLTIAKKIVERHGGKIWFESLPRVGTTFRFTLKTHNPT